MFNSAAMNRVPLLLSALVFAVMISSCAVSTVPRATQEAAFKQVAGEWVYSHAGASTVGVGWLDASSTVAAHLKDARIDVHADGRLTWLGMGRTAEARGRVVQSNDLAIEIRGAGWDGTGTLVYDRKTDLLTLLGEVKVKDGDGQRSNGTMPVYFRRARR